MDWLRGAWRRISPPAAPPPPPDKAQQLAAEWRLNAELKDRATRIADDAAGILQALEAQGYEPPARRAARRHHRRQSADHAAPADREESR